MLAPPAPPPKGDPHICLGHLQSRGRIGHFVQNTKEVFPGRRQASPGLRHTSEVRWFWLQISFGMLRDSVGSTGRPLSSGERQPHWWVNETVSTHLCPAHPAASCPRVGMQAALARVLALA